MKLNDWKNKFCMTVSLAAMGVLLAFFFLPLSYSQEGAPATSAVFAPAAAPAAAAATSGAPATSWADSILGVLTSPIALGALAWLLVRVETFLQGRTKINLQKATGVAHSVFNTLWDAGIIKNGRFREAEEQFFNQFDKAFFTAHEHDPDANAIATAHSTFTQLFTAHTGDDVPQFAR